MKFLLDKFNTWSKTEEIYQGPIQYLLRNFEKPSWSLQPVGFEEFRFGFFLVFTWRVGPGGMRSGSVLLHVALFSEFDLCRLLLLLLCFHCQAEIEGQHCLLTQQPYCSHLHFATALFCESLGKYYFHFGGTSRDYGFVRDVALAGWGTGNVAVGESMDLFNLAAPDPCFRTRLACWV